MDAEEIDSAVAIIKGDAISDSLVFKLLVDMTSTPNKLYGTVSLPPTGSAWTVTIRMYDSLQRKIGEGSFDIDESYFDAGRYVANVVVGIESAKPRIDSIDAVDTVVGINDTIRLFAAASDSFGGEVTRYEWRFGESEWTGTGAGDTNVIAPATAGPYVCSLRVTDDDRNVVMNAVVVTVETRAPVADAGNDTAVGINDTVHLHGSRSRDETHIVAFAWKHGDGAWLADADGDTTFVAPATAESRVCSLKVVDDDGNSAYYALLLTVEIRPPIANAGLDTAVGLVDAVRLEGSGSTDETAIVKYAWKCGSGQWIAVSTGDTIVVAPASDQFWPCSLRVTDDDGNVAYDAIRVVVGAPLVVDIDGNAYATVAIGNQVWTAENIRTTRYNDGAEIPHVTVDSVWAELSTPAYCFPRNTTDTLEQKKWGALYNWYAVNTGKLAPAGWRVPTGADWDTLQNYLIANGYNYDGTTTGNKIAKAMAAQTDWHESTHDGAIGNNLSTNNRSGFSALPVSYRTESGSFRRHDSYALFQSANAQVNRCLRAEEWGLWFDPPIDERAGCSVRLVKD